MKARAASVSAWALVAALAAPGAAEAAPPLRKQALAVGKFKIVERESGPDNYYSIVNDPQLPFIRASYKPGQKTAVLGVQLADADRESARKLSWRWRAQRLPSGAEECVKGKGDAAAVVYLLWKRGLRYYTLKYVWSTGGVQGKGCRNKRNMFAAQDTILLQVGGPTGTWKKEEVDLQREFRRHFEGGDASADVPPFLGIGIMSDGDQTKSESAADYADFVVHHAP